MSTRSSITIYNKDKNKYESIYCHFDGYPTGVGEYLTTYYNNYYDAKSLIDLGSLSSIEDTIKNCYAYHRDRGDDWDECKPLLFNSLEDVVSNWKYVDYNYYFDEQSNQWLVTSGHDLKEDPFEPVSDRILREKAEDEAENTKYVNSIKNEVYKGGNDKDIKCFPFIFRFVKEENDIELYCLETVGRVKKPLYFKIKSENSTLTPLISEDGSPICYEEIINYLMRRN